MYRLLIVDDEPIIVDGLFEFFQEARHLELDLCKAYSGDEALEIMSRIYVDVVISDIRMPGINGLQLLEVIMKRWPECRVIILSGYDEFEYIYKAVKYKGVSYFLKTEGFAKILQAVEKYLEEIEQNVRNDELLTKITYKLKTVIPLLQKEFLSGILKDSFIKITQHGLDELEIPLLADKPVLMLLGRIDRSTDTCTKSITESSFKIKLVMEQYLDPGIRSINAVIEDNNMLWLMQPDGQGDGSDGSGKGDLRDYEHIDLQVKRILEAVQNFCRKSMNVRISFALERRPVYWSRIAEKYAGLDYLLNSKIKSNMEILLTNMDASAAWLDEGAHLSRAARRIDYVFIEFKIIGTFLENGMKTEFHSSFSVMQDRLIELCGGEYALSLEVYTRISLFFISHINRIGLMKTFGADAEVGRLFRIERLGAWDEAFSFFRRIADYILEVHASEDNRKSINAVLKIQKYAQEHLSEDLSLATLSDQIFFNPQYLSRLFKQVTGINLLSYINELKLNMVKELLSTNHIRIHEIGARVGFLSAPYFTRFFKKATGMTPQEYRSNILANQVKKG